MAFGTPRSIWSVGGRFRRALTGAPLLDVDLLEFEEVKAPTVHAARVALHVVLSTDRVLLERTITVSEPAAGTFETFVAAMAMALQASTAEVARSAGEALDSGFGGAQRLRDRASKMLSAKPTSVETAPTT